MKKILLLSLLLIAKVSFSQIGTLYVGSIKDSTTAFGRLLPANILILDRALGTLCKLDSATTATTCKLSNSYVTLVGGGGSFDSFYVEQGTSTVQGWVGNKDTVTIDTTGLSAMTILTRMTKYSYQNTASGAITINCSNGYTHFLTTAGNLTGWTLSNFPVGLPVRITIMYGDVHTVSAIGSTVWSGGIAPTYTSVAGRIDVVTLIYNGTNYLGFYSPNHF